MRSLLVLACAAALVLTAGRAQDVPVVAQRFTDLSGSIRPDELRALNEKLQRFEEETSNQIVVLMVPTSGEEEIEQYALRVAEANKLGKKGRDNGVLFLIAKGDRKVRIEVGYGLEGALPDATSNQIIRNIVIPRFREGAYYEGIDAGVDGIIAATKGEFQGDGASGKRKRKSLPVVFISIMIILMFFIGSIFRSRRHHVGPGSFWGGFGGGGFGGGTMGGFGGGGGGSFGGGGGFSGGGGSFGGGGSSGSW